MTTSSRSATPIEGGATASHSSIAVIVVGMLVGYVAGGLLLVFWTGLFGSGGVGPALAGTVGLWVGFLGAPLYEARSRGESVRTLVRLPTRPTLGVPVGLVVGVGLQFIAIPALYWLIAVFSGPLDVGGASKDLTKNATGSSWIAVVIVVGIGAPIVEEIFFRGLLMQLIGERFGIIAGIIGSSVVFAGTHFQVIQFPGLLVAGLVFAVLAARSSRLGPAIACHMAFNLTTLVQLMMANQ